MKMFATRRFLLLCCFVTLIVSSCTACISYVKRRTVSTTSENVGAATYQLSETLIIDRTEEYENKEYSVPVSVEKYGGTAFMIDRVEGGALIMTAGHVCDPAGGKTDGGSKIMMSAFELQGNDGESYPAIVVVDDDTIDVCVLYAEISGNPIRIASRDPEIGSHVRYVGAPGTFWLPGTVQVFEGLFGGTVVSGRVYYSLVTAWAEGGASGSPVFSPDGVIGVLTKNTHASTGGGAVTIAVNWRELRKPWAKAREKVKEFASNVEE